jgi:hypothetical protein
MGSRSIFRESFMGAPSARRPVRRAQPFGVKPPTIAVNSYDIPPGALKDWLRHVVPDGYSGTYPRVVKTLDGEYQIYADGSAEFTPLGRLPGARFSIL